MQNFIRKPSVDLYPGIRVEEDTSIEFANETVTQSIKDLVLHSVAKYNGEGFETTQTTTVQLQVGDILLFEEGGRGYIKPVGGFCSIEEGIEDLESIKDLGGSDVQD